ncbi:MAG TPA: hypothetical protein VIJ07_04570 [Dermatophilaceae bacterium]
MTQQIMRRSRPARQHTAELDRWAQTPTNEVVTQTEFLLENVLDRTLAEIVVDWAADLSRDPSEAVAALLARPVQYVADSDAVAAIDFVSRALGVPDVDVLAAARIKERTFHEWKSKGREPRLGSQGQLWKLVGIVEDLAAGGLDVATWFRARPALRDLLRSGDLDTFALTPVHEDIVDEMLIERGLASAGLAGPETDVPKAAGPQAPRRAKVAARSVPRTPSLHRKV